MTTPLDADLHYYEMRLPQQWAAFEERIRADQETAILRAPVSLSAPREYHVYLRGQYVSTCGSLEEAHALVKSLRRQAAH